MKKTLLLLAMILFSISTYTQCLIGDCNNGYGEKSYNGHIYKGNFLNGKRDGYGEYFWTFGDVYKGYWKNDDWNGYGERTYAAGRGDMSGVIEKGRWENGMLVDPNAKPKINKPLVNKNNSNSQNKSVIEQKTNAQTKTVVQSSKKEMPRKYPVKPKTYNTNTIKKCQCCNKKFKVGTGWGSDSQEGVYNYSSSWASAKRIQGEYLIAAYGLSGENDGGIDYCSKKCAIDCGDF